MITTINNSDSNSKLCNIVFNLECENEPQLPAEHYVNVFKTKLIGNNLWYCYCNFKSGRILSYIYNLFPHATNICKAEFTLKNIDKHFPKLLLETSIPSSNPIQPPINNSNQITIPVQKKLEYVITS